jgi:hypothetical protein
MYNSGSHFLFAQVGLKHARRLAGLAVFCALSIGIWMWSDRQQMTVAAPQIHQQIVLPKEGEIELSRVFEPRSFAEMMAAHSLGMWFSAPLFNVNYGEWNRRCRDRRGTER